MFCGVIKIMIIIGLTGGIASGKSIVAGMFAQKGAFVIDADTVAHQVIKSGEPAWEEIVSFFGTGILSAEGEIDRKKLAALVFNNEEHLKKLNAIVHPRVGAMFALIIGDLPNKKNPPEVIIYDVPLLIEAGIHKTVDAVVLVYAPRALQEERIQNRDGLTLEEIEARLAAQMSFEEKKNFADYIIENTGSLDETRGQVDDFWNLLPLLIKKKKK